MRPRLRRAEGQPAYAVPVREPPAGRTQLRGQARDPAFEDLAAALLDERLCVGEHELPDRGEVAARAQQLDCGVELAVGLCERRGFPAQRQQLARRERLARLALQEVAEQRMELVRRR